MGVKRQHTLDNGGLSSPYARKHVLSVQDQHANNDMLYANPNMESRPSNIHEVQTS